MSTWRERLLASTRGRVLSLLRWGPRTVNDLASALELTDNAVRLHLSALERDGLVHHEGYRRGVGKPAHVYRLTGEAEGLFPKGYAAVLGEILDFVRERDGGEGLEGFLRAVGHRAGARAVAAGGGLRDRVNVAVSVLEDLGGLARVEEESGSLLIQGFSCPLAGIVPTNPEACGLAEELVSVVAGAPVTECCDRSGPIPKCAFRVGVPAG